MLGAWDSALEEGGRGIEGDSQVSRFKDALDEPVSDIKPWEGDLEREVASEFCPHRVG